MASDGNCCLFESDPGVFTELIKGFGVRGVQVEELYSLDKDQFDELRSVHGLIFFFNWRLGDEPSGEMVVDDRLQKIFFAKQLSNRIDMNCWMGGGGGEYCSINRGQQRRCPKPKLSHLRFQRDIDDTFRPLIYIDARMLKVYFCLKAAVTNA